MSAQILFFGDAPFVRMDDGYQEHPGQGEVVFPAPAQPTPATSAAAAAVERVARGEGRELASPKLRFRIDEWHAAARFAGEPPARQWLLAGVAPLGTVGLLCSMGGVGKSYAALELGFRVACGSRPGDLPIFGGPVERHGAVVFLTAENDEAEVHRRLHALDPDGVRRRGGRLFVVPLPSAGGPFPLVRQDRDGVALTPEFVELAAQLQEIPDLSLIVFDPLQTFAHGDINADPAVPQILLSALAQLAAQTAATVIVAHHMRKPSGRTDSSPAEAREAIRGSTAIVDGVRWAVAIWPAPGDVAKDVLRQLGRSTGEAEAVYCCAVVKKNADQSGAVRLLVRDTRIGLLKDVTGLVTPSGAWSIIQLDQLKAVIAAKAKAGFPFTLAWPLPSPGACASTSSPAPRPARAGGQRGHSSLSQPFPGTAHSCGNATDRERLKPMWRLEKVVPGDGPFPAVPGALGNGVSA